MESDELDDVELGIQTPAAAGQTRTGYRITLFSCGDDRRPEDRDDGRCLFGNDDE